MLKFSAHHYVTVGSLLSRLESRKPKWFDASSISNLSQELERIGCKYSAS